MSVHRVELVETVRRVAVIEVPDGFDVSAMVGVNGSWMLQVTSQQRSKSSRLR
jgi:hypothetical protein